MANYREYLKGIAADILTTTGFTVSNMFPMTVSTYPACFIRLFGERDTGERDVDSQNKIWEVAVNIYVKFQAAGDPTGLGLQDTELSRVLEIIRVAFETADLTDANATFTNIKNQSGTVICTEYDISVIQTEIDQVLVGDYDKQMVGDMEFIGKICYTMGSQEFTN